MSNTKLTKSGAQLQSSVNKAEKLPVTSSADENKVLKVDSNGNIITGTNSAGMTNPMTTQGDLIVGGANGTPTRLAKGTAGQVLKVGTNGLEYGNESGMTNPMTTQGDLIVGGTSGTPSRLPIDAEKCILQITSTGIDNNVIEWKPYLTQYSFRITNVLIDSSQTSIDINVKVVTRVSDLLHLTASTFANLINDDRTIKATLEEPDYNTQIGTVGTNIRPATYYGADTFQFLSSIISSYRRFTLTSSSDFTNFTSQVL